MAFRKKFEKVINLNPDLIIIQECENDEKLKSHLKSINYSQLIWYCNNPHKGVAIISFNNSQIELNENHNPEFEYIIPVNLKVEKRRINLFCIWAMPHKTERIKRYIGQIWGAINFYSNKLNEDSILIGDFNINAIWDKKKIIGNHSDVVGFLDKKNIHSIYHQKTKLEHGDEQNPTFFLLKQKEKPYHIDYCFASKNLFSNQTTIEIGKYQEWIKLSDHMPLTINNIL